MTEFYNKLAWGQAHLAYPCAQSKSNPMTTEGHEYLTEGTLLEYLEKVKRGNNIARPHKASVTESQIS